MRFDRTAPGGGMVVYTKVENGKCLLEFQFFYEEEDCVKDNTVMMNERERRTVEKVDVGAENIEAVENGDVGEEYFVEIRVLDQCEEMVYYCNYPIKEEENARGLLLHPHLWNGLEDPYLYKVSAGLRYRESNGITYTVQERKQILPLRSFCRMERKGWYLNGKLFERRGVLYTLPSHSPDGVSPMELAKADLELLKQMGANTICLGGGMLDEEFIELCEEMGFVIWCGVRGQQNHWGCIKETSAERLVPDSPGFSEEMYGWGNTLTEGEQHTPTDLYFYYKACWSKEPFVHIVDKSLKRQENGNYSLTVYSNQKRVALYVDGTLFELRVGAPEYVFEEIPGKKIPLLITVEAGECRRSITFY